MSRPDLVCLRLYPDALVRADGIVRLLRRRAGRVCARELSYFQFKNDERAFARELLAQHPRFWLFRTHQGRFAGDFVAVDMSERDVARRRAFCFDLKRGAKLVLGGGGAGNAFVGLEAVVRRLALGRSEAERGRVITVDHPLERATGDAAELLALLSG